MFDCMYTLFLPVPYTYLTLLYLLYSTLLYRWSVCVMDPAIFLSPFLCLRGRQNYPKVFEWNTNHEICFLFLDLLLGKTV